MLITTVKVQIALSSWVHLDSLIGVQGAKCFDKTRRKRWCHHIQYTKLEQNVPVIEIAGASAGAVVKRSTEL